METTAILEQGEAAGQATTVAVSTAPLRGGRNIDGFFRARTTTKPRTVDTPPAEDSIAALAAKAPALLPAVARSAPEMRDVIKPTAKPRRPSASRTVNHARAHKPQAAKARSIQINQTAAKSQRLEVRRGVPNHVHHHAAQHSRTLRRDTVPAPEPTTHNLLNPQGEVERTIPGLTTAKRSVAAIDPDRLARAQSTAKSPLVAHHTAAAARSLTPTFAPVAVQPPPADGPNLPQTVPGPTPDNGEESAPSPQPTNKSTNLYEHALANASGFVDLRARKTAYRHKARVHIASMLAGSLVLITIAGVVAWQNSPALQLKVASIRAGVATGMPDFAAAGFTYSGVHAGDNRLTFGLKGQSGTYQLTQTNTNLSDADMIQSVGSTNASGTPVYQVVLAGNTVVYRFSNTSVTWVSNGSWYTLSGDSAISDSQIKSIVQHT